MGWAQACKLEQSYKQEYGEETFFDLELVARQCPGVCIVRHQDMDFSDNEEDYRQEMNVCTNLFSWRLSFLMPSSGKKIMLKSVMSFL